MADDLGACWLADPQEQEQLRTQVLELLACGASLTEVLGALARGVAALQPGCRLCRVAD